MVENKETESKTLREKISEPILNATQIVAMMMAVLYEVVSNLLIYALMEDPNWVFIIGNVIVGIIVIVGIALLRAAFPIEVPDSTIWAAFWLIWKQIVDVITDPKITDPDLKMNILEKAIQWDVREWDIAYQEKLSAQIQYYKERLNDQIEAVEKKFEDLK